MTFFYLYIQIKEKIIKRKMKKKITKSKLVFTFPPDLIEFLEENFENKSKYVEYLIYKDMKDNNLLKNNVLYDYR